MQRENERLQQQLRRAENIIEIQKKLAVLLGAELSTADEVRPAGRARPQEQEAPFGLVAQLAAQEGVRRACRLLGGAAQPLLSGLAPGRYGVKTSGNGGGNGS